MDTINRTFAAVNDEDDPDFPAPMSNPALRWPAIAVPAGKRWAIRAGCSSRPALPCNNFRGSAANQPSNRSGPTPACIPLTASRPRRRWPPRNYSAPAALNRAVIAVATTTGTGWINEAEASALEYMYNGNTAIVEHAVLVPAELAVVPGRPGERAAGRTGAVRGGRRVGPCDAARTSGPKLVVFGESLGSFGGEAPFLALNNLVARTDGALFSGPTFKNTIWTTLTRDRDAGSPEWLPIYDKGENVRFSRDSRESGPARRALVPPSRGVSATRVRTRSRGGRPTCCSPNRTGCGSPVGTTCPAAWSGFRW